MYESYLYFKKPSLTFRLGKTITGTAISLKNYCAIGKPTPV